MPRAHEREPQSLAKHSNNSDCLIVISVFGSAFDDDDIEAASEVIRGQWVGPGSVVKELEGALSAHCGGASVALVNSASAGLEMAIKALGAPKGGEVIVPTNTWNSCANAVFLAGHRPVFCDVDPVSGLMAAETVRREISSRTVAIMVVHYAGYCVDMAAMAEFGLPIIEDAAHSISSTYRGTRAGTIGDIGVFSFDSVKNLASPDLGAVVSLDPEKTEHILTHRYAGIRAAGYSASKATREWWIPSQRGIEPKFAPNDLAAALVLSQLRKIHQTQNKREALWMRYLAALSDVVGITTPPWISPEENHSYFTFFVKIAGGRRNQLAHFLLERGIYSTVRYYPLHLQGVFKSFVKSEQTFPGAEKFSSSILNLPLHPRLTDSDTDTVASTIREFMD